ncbi:leucyl aminopeptidase [bacterium]|nr:leucyl aminopeptidase [bacterium]|tara:strand:- start:10805 stop:12217 length:1413 start_codon:yes stop_codon:yes gene_type:complete
MRIITKNVSQKHVANSKNITPVLFTKNVQIEFVQEKGQKSFSFGIGKKKVTRRTFITLLRHLIICAKQHKIQKITFALSDLPAPKGLSPFELGSIIAENFEMANFEFRKFKARPKEGWNEIQEVIIEGTVSADFKKGIERGRVIGEEVNKSRTLSNTPGGDMTPTLLANKAKSAATGTGIKVSILGKKEMQKLKMGAVLGVAKGSEEEPKFIILEYKGGGQEEPIVLVGKGVTFDTGGLNLKPEQGISDMHMDMSGGAAVIHTVIAAAKLKLKKNIVGLVPAVENMPSGASYRPGDILKSMSGKTIEVLNTDAEGRVILADALTYAKKYKPRLVVDVATLTGAALVALGQHACAFLTKDKKLENLFPRLGEESGDYMWQFPLWDEYEESVRGNFGDVSNIPTSNSRYAGVISSSMFLYQFVKDQKDPSKQMYPWAHIDMAPRMTAAPGDYLAKGSAGAPIRFLVKLLETY